MSIILHATFVGAFIASFAGLSHWAAVAVCVVISVKTEFSDNVKVKDTSQLINGMSKVL